MKIVSLLVTIGFYLTFLKAQTIVNVPQIIAQPNNIDISYFVDFIDSSEAHQGESKIVSFNPIYQTIVVDNNNRWPQGTWLRGYYDRGDFWKLSQNSVNCTHNTAGWVGCHPLVRVNDKMIRAHIHTNRRYPNSFSYNQNIQKIIDGIDYMIDSQQNTPLDPVEHGGFTWWNFRPDFLVPNTNEDRNQNFTHAYETSHALRAMSEAYMYFQNYNINYYRMTDLYDAIVKAADNLYEKNPNDNQACDFDNNNFRGLGVWALAGAYKVTKNVKYFNGARDICNIIMQQQNTSGGLADGMWLTGGTHDEDDGCGNTIYHDTRIYYHSMILRGLVEMMDITPNNSQYSSWKITLISQIKKAVNHMINYRVSFYDNPPHSYQGQLRSTWLATNGGTTCAKWAYYYYEEVLETIAMLTLYSNYQAYFSCDERKSLRNLLLVLGVGSHSNYSGYLENFVQYAYYADYLYAFDHNQRIYPLDENNVNVWYNTTVSPEISSKCPNQGSVTLTANLNSAVNYLWNNGLGNGQSKTVSPNVQTTYSVTGTDVHGCSTTAQAVVMMNSSLCTIDPSFPLFRTTTNKSLTDLVALILYPNPTSNEVVIEINNNNLLNSHIIIYNLMGKEVYKTELNSKRNIISLKGLNKGTYIYKVISDNKIISIDKILKIK